MRVEIIYKLVTRVIWCFGFLDRLVKGGDILDFGKGGILEKGDGDDPPYKLCIYMLNMSKIGDISKKSIFHLVLIICICLFSKKFLYLWNYNYLTITWHHIKHCILQQNIFSTFCWKANLLEYAKTRWLTLGEWGCPLDNDPKLAVG